MLNTIHEEKPQTCENPKSRNYSADLLLTEIPLYNINSNSSTRNLEMQLGDF